MELRSNWLVSAPESPSLGLYLFYDTVPLQVQLYRQLHVKCCELVMFHSAIIQLSLDTEEVVIINYFLQYTDHCTAVYTIDANLIRYRC